MAHRILPRNRMSYLEANEALLKKLGIAKKAFSSTATASVYLGDTEIRAIVNEILDINKRIPSVAINNIPSGYKGLAYETLGLSHDDLYAAGYSGNPYSDKIGGLLGATLKFDIEKTSVNNFYSYAKQGSRYAILNYIESELSERKGQKTTYVDGFGRNSSSKIEEPETHDKDPFDTDDNPQLSWQFLANALSRIDLETKRETLEAIFDHIREGGSFPSKRELARKLGISPNAAYLRMDRAYHSFAEELRREIEPLSHLGTLFVNDIGTVRRTFDAMKLEARHRKKEGERIP